MHSADCCQPLTPLAIRQAPETATAFALALDSCIVKANCKPTTATTTTSNNERDNKTSKKQVYTGEFASSRCFATTKSADRNAWSKDIQRCQRALLFCTMKTGANQLSGRAVCKRYMPILLLSSSQTSVVNTHSKRLLQLALPSPLLLGTRYLFVAAKAQKEVLAYDLLNMHEPPRHVFIGTAYFSIAYVTKRDELLVAKDGNVLVCFYMNGEDPLELSGGGYFSKNWNVLAETAHEIAIVQVYVSGTVYPRGSYVVLFFQPASRTLTCGTYTNCTMPRRAGDLVTIFSAFDTSQRWALTPHNGNVREYCSRSQIVRPCFVTRDNEHVRLEDHAIYRWKDSDWTSVYVQQTDWLSNATDVCVHANEGVWAAYTPTIWKHVHFATGRLTYLMDNE